MHPFSTRRAAALGWLFACLLPGTVRAADDYTLGSDSQPPGPELPRGEVIKQPPFTNSALFPGTTRDWWLYVPKQYDPARPASVMVFQDGGGYVGRTEGGFRVPNVFDRLIHSGEMPVTIGIFINPGIVPAPTADAQPRFNRSFEYDSLGDRYARFLLEEILPAVAKSYHLSTNPNDRAIGGASSGAICAWTVAWERPDAFRRVFSTIGTYVGLRGGNDYPTLIRKTEPKPIRVFLQDGSADLNIYGGDWWLANQEMLSALKFAGYAVTNVWGDGGHNGKHAGAILPDAMRWLWRDHGKPIEAAANTSNPVLKQILIPGEDWRLVSEGHKFTEGPAVNAQGEVFFTDIPNHRIHKVGLDGRVSVFAEDTHGAAGLCFDADGRLFATGKNQFLRFGNDGKPGVVFDNAPGNDLVVLGDSAYYTDPGEKKIWLINSALERRVVDAGIASPNGIAVSPDHTLLYVADTKSRWVYSFQIASDGSLRYRQPYFHLHVPDPAVDSGADGLKVDVEGRLYVATRMGVQICDQPGRVNAILPKPHDAWLANLVFGGPNLDTLFVTCGDKVFKRRLNARGVISWQAPSKPPTPRL